MPSQWVYFPPGPDSPFPYRKARVDVRELDFFYDLGAVDDQLAFTNQAEEPAPPPEPPKEPEPDPNAPKGDKGWGRPGTLEFYEHQIADFTSKDDLITFVFEVTGRRVVNRGGLEDVQRNALKRIKEHLDNGQS